MDKNEPIIFETVDFRGARILFTQKKFEEKKLSHPELGSVEFIRAVQCTLQEPEEVWPDVSNRRRWCYYGENGGWYVKVVVHVDHNKHTFSRVVSAYRTDRIKEKKYKCGDYDKIV